MTEEEEQTLLGALGADDWSTVREAISRREIGFARRMSTTS